MIPPADLPRLARRPRASHKHDYGRVVVIGGSSGMAGAPVLAALAALRCGAGLVEVLVPEPIAAVAASFDPCLMVRGLPADGDGAFAAAADPSITARVAGAHAVVIGPGLGRGTAIPGIVARRWTEARVPTVFDADALWALAPRPPSGGLAAGPRILTPHEGELGRFVTAGTGDSRTALEDAAERLAEATQSVVLLKGPGTLVTHGGRRWHNPTGNPGMATGGTGDVLAGMIAALCCQPCASPRGPTARAPVGDVARLAVWAHGRAGDLAAAQLGEVSLTARDLLAHLPGALLELLADRHPA